MTRPSDRKYAHWLSTIVVVVALLILAILVDGLLRYLNVLG